LLFDHGDIFLIFKMDNSIKGIPDFDDILFESRNKEYGAYSLRKRYNRVVIGSLIISIIIGCAAVLIPYFRIPAKKGKDVVYSVRYVTMENMRPPDEQVYVPDIPAPPAAPKVESIVKYTAPVVVDSVPPVEKAPVMTADLIPVESLDRGTGGGIVNGTGTESGVLSDIEGGGTGNNEPFIIVQVMPTFKGGDMNSFREWIAKRTVYPKVAADKGIAGRVIITFIIETDGSVSNVKVVQDRKSVV
jgi:protein TonB